jgi:hypothetical protein
MGLVSLTTIEYVGRVVASAWTGMNPEKKPGMEELTLLMGTQGWSNVD